MPLDAVLAAAAQICHGVDPASLEQGDIGDRKGSVDADVVDAVAAAAVGVAAGAVVGAAAAVLPVLVGASVTVAPAVVRPRLQQQGRVQWVFESEQPFAAVVLFGLA